jgi:hypothetical protein
MTLLSEKPRHGVASRKSAPHPGINEANSTAPIGLRFRCWEIVSGTVDAPNNGTPQISQLACKAAYTAGGAAGGALVGGAAGGVVGGVAGGAGGTLVAPGVGTVGGGIAGAEGGATAGAWAGGALGGLLGNALGNIMCSSGGGGGGSSSKPSDAACHAIVQGAKNTCTNSFSGGGLSAWRNCVRAIVEPTGCDF